MVMRSRAARSRTRTAALTVAIATVLIAGLWPRRPVTPSRPTRARAPAAPAALVPGRVAVAVVRNATGDARLDPLGVVAADWLTRQLARTSSADVIDVGTLYVQGRSSAGARTAPTELARRASAALVVDGRYDRAGDSIRFSAQVLDGATARTLRAVDPVVAPAADPLAAVDALRRGVAAALGTLVDPRASASASPATRPPRYDAYEQYVAAQALYWGGDRSASLPLFRRAVALDSTFATALAFLAANAADVGQCALVDSIAAARRELPAWERTTIALSRADCASDHAEHNQLLRGRLAANPREAFSRWLVASGERQLNHPRAALAILESLDPARDVTWLADSGKTMYWRDVAAARHAAGDYSGELATATAIERGGHAPLAGMLFRARALAALGRAAEALALVDSLALLPADAAIVAAHTGGRQRAPRMATAGWAMTQMAAELGAHGRPSESRRAAVQAAAWFARRPPADSALGAGFEAGLAHAEALLLAGDAAAARRVAERVVELDSASVEARGTLGMAAAAAGDRAGVEGADAWLARRPPRFPLGMPTLYRARIAALRGARGRALDLLESLPNHAHPYDYSSFHADPSFATLANDPRFMRLITPR